MLPPMESGKYDVVMGSRLNGSMSTGAMSRLNFMGNVALTQTANILFPNGHKASDICTGLWGFTDEVIHALDLEAPHFDIEAEITAKLLKSKIKIVNVPINYKGRSYSEGKKIGFKDFLLSYLSNGHS